MRKTASDKSILLKLASSLPVGDEARRAILAGLQKSAWIEPHLFPHLINIPGKHILNRAFASGNSQVTGGAQVFGEAMIYDNAKVSGEAQVFGKAKIGGTAEIFGGTWDGSEGEILEGRWKAPGVSV